MVKLRVVFSCCCCCKFCHFPLLLYGCIRSLACLICLVYLITHSLGVIWFTWNEKDAAVDRKLHRSNKERFSIFYFTKKYNSKPSRIEKKDSYNRSQLVRIKALFLLFLLALLSSWEGQVTMNQTWLICIFGLLYNSTC